MTSDERNRWSRVKQIFETARTSAPGERAALVGEACRGDDSLRAEVESLLAAYDDAGSFAEQPAFEALRSHSEQHTSALTTGTALGPYRIVEPLDAGGMGEVYRAFDTKLRRDVAVKVLPAAVSADPNWVRHLQTEARVLAALNHPHIATIHGLESEGELHAIVMELVDGPTLADRLDLRPLSVEETLVIARQMTDALEAAHEKGIIHRDLKPANVKLTATGSVKVLDFGLALAARAEPHDAGDTESSGVAGQGIVAGTPAYMSPEQMRGESVDARTDVWAFGCVVFEMLTAHKAFSNPEEFEPDWRRLPQNVPPAIRRMLRRCLERDSRRRIHHIADARLEIDEAVSHLDEGDETRVAATAVRRARAFGIAAAALAIALTAAIGAWLLRAPQREPELRVLEVTTPRTSDPFSFAISPDGRRLAFVAERGGQPMLWVRELDSANARALPGTEGARRPFWSPDSRSIGFFMNSELKRIDARGGAPQTLTYLLAGTTATWGPDGTILFSSTGSPSLRRISADGGPVQIVTTPAKESAGHRHPQFLPGGRQFLFFVGGPDSVRGVYLGALGSPEVTRLVRSDTEGEYMAPGRLLFIRQGTLWKQRIDLGQRKAIGEPAAVADSVDFDSVDGTGAFSTSDAGVLAYRTARPTITQLAWFDRTGRALGAFGSSEQIGVTNIRLSPNGQRVAAERSRQSQTDLWLLDSSRQMRFTHASDASRSRLPIWSPNGDRIAFESIRAGSIALAVKSSTDDSSESEHVLYASPDIKIPCDWSPDGRFIVYYIPDPKSGTDLWILPLDTGVPSPLLRTDANELWGQFSPDGRWMAYQSNETGRYEIYVRPFPSGGGPIPVSTAGGVYPRWSHDGKELYFIAPDARMMAARIRATPMSIEAGTPTALFQTRRLGGGLNVIGRGPQYDIADDGRFLINVDPQSSAQPITLLLNWRN